MSGGYSLYKVLLGVHLLESQAYKLEGTQVSFLQTTLLSKASKIISIKCSLPKPVAKTIFQLDGTYAFHCISLHYSAFHCISVSGWILFYRGESGSLLAGLLPVPYISLHNGFTFWIILYSVGFFSTGFGCLPWHFPDLSPSKATCPRTVPFRSSFLFYSGPG